VSACTLLTIRWLPSALVSSADITHRIRVAVGRESSWYSGKRRSYRILHHVLTDSNTQITYHLSDEYTALPNAIVVSAIIQHCLLTLLQAFSYLQDSFSIILWNIGQITSVHPPHSAWSIVAAITSFHSLVYPTTRTAIDTFPEEDHKFHSYFFPASPPLS
jgi:hypothetical protein